MTRNRWAVILCAFHLALIVISITADRLSFNTSDPLANKLLDIKAISLIGFILLWPVALMATLRVITAQVANDTPPIGSSHEQDRDDSDDQIRYARQSDARNVKYGIDMVCCYIYLVLSGIVLFWILSNMCAFMFPALMDISIPSQN